MRSAIACVMLALLAAAPAASATEPAAEARLSAAFQERILPALRAAETNAATVESAADGFHGWLREIQLNGYPETAFRDEYTTGKKSLITGLKNAYEQAQKQCRRTPGKKAADDLATPVITSMLFGWNEDDMLFPTFDEDYRACTAETVYRITVRTSSSDEKHGVLGELKYVAFLGSAKKGSEHELEGIGAYSGFQISTPKETVNYGKGTCTAWGEPHRFTLRGELEATGGFIDMSALGGANGIIYTLATTDWPLKPMFVDVKDAYAQTAEEKDALKGMGTTARIDPIPLTGKVTTVKDTRTEFGGDCAGKITTSEDIRIELIRR